MRSVRTIFLILAAIAALVAAEILLGRRSTDVASFKSTLAEFGSPVTEIEIVRRGAPKIRLVKDEGWRLVSPYGGAAHEPAVLKLVDALTLTVIPDKDRISDSVLEKSGRDRAFFSLSDPHLAVTLKAKDGATASVSFGVPTPTADGVYAAVGGVEAVFVVPTAVFQAADVSASDLRQRAIFSFPTESVSEFSVRRGAAAAVSFVRDGEGWRCGKKAASVAKLRGYLDRLTAAQAASFVWPVGATNESAHASEALLSGFGLDAENAVTVSLKGADGVERRIAFGKEAGAGAVYALAQDGTAVVTVPSALKDEAAQDPMHFTDLRLFPVDAASVAAFTLREGDTAYTLVRAGKDGWRLESPVSAEADAAVVGALLSKIVSLTSADADEKGLAVSLASDAKAVGVKPSSVLPKQGLNALRSRTVVALDAEAVKRLVRTPQKAADATAVVHSRERKAWNVEKPEGRGEADAAAIGRVLKALAKVEAIRVEKLKVTAADLDDYGLDAPWLTIAVDQEREGAIRRNLLIGKPTRGGRYATVGSTDAIFVIPDAVVRVLETPLVKGL